MSAEDQTKMLVEARSLGEELVSMTRDYPPPQVTLAAEILLAFHAVETRMPLQELMSNLFANVPKMYAIALEREREAEATSVVIAEG